MRVPPTGSARSQKLQLLVAAFVPLLIVVLSVSGFVWAQRDVTVVVDGRTLHMTTQAADVATVLEEAGVSVDADDLVMPALDAPLGDERAAVLVRHSVPVELDLGGGKVSLDVVGETVADALVAAGADPSSNPAVTPPLETELEPGMTISVPDVFVRVYQRDTTIAAPVRYEKDSTLGKGHRRVIVAGSPGTLMSVYRVLVTGGTEGAPVLTEEVVVDEPKTRIVAVGTGFSAAPVDPKTGEEITDPPSSGTPMRVLATGYSAKEPGMGTTTKNGSPAVRGVIAVDPNVISLGTRVYVPGYGYAIAADTGGMINGKHIDLCFDTLAEMDAWGSRTITIIVLD